MDLQDYLLALRKSWYIVVVAALVGILIAYSYAHRLPDSYRATGSIFVSTTQGSNVSDLSSGSTFTRNTVASYATLATTPAVLSPVIGELGLKTTPVKLARQITAVSPLNTVFVQITVTDGDAARSADIANAVTRSLRTVAIDLAPTTASGRSSISMSIVTTAQTPTVPVGPNRHLMDAIGFLLGLVAGILLALVRIVVDTRIRTSRDVAIVTDAPLVGTIRRAERGGPTHVTLLDHPDSTAAEDYRRLRATLQFAGQDGPVGSLVVTAPTDGSQSTAVALDVAFAMAERGKSVLLIDADLRTPSLAKIISREDAPGLTNVLDDELTLAEAAVLWHEGVSVLTTGPTPSNPHFLLGSTGLAQLIDRARGPYDFVVVLAAPLLAYSDALALVQSTEGALVVVSARKTTRTQLRKTLQSLGSVQADVIGVVLSGTRRADGAGQTHGGPRPVSVRPTGEPGTDPDDPTGDPTAPVDGAARALR